MSKGRLLRIASYLLVIVIFSLVAFIVPLEKTATFWVAYAFGIVACILQEAICIMSWDKAMTTKSRFLGIPQLMVGVYYLIAQLIVSLVFIFMPHLSFVIPLGISILLLALFAILMIGTEAARDEIQRIDDKVAAKVGFIKGLQVEVELLILHAHNDEVKRQLKDLAESIRYSDPMSTETVAPVEAQMTALLAEIKATIRDASGNPNPLIANMKYLLSERNGKVRLSK
jgi:hypothetical protein